MVLRIKRFLFLLITIFLFIFAAFQTKPFETALLNSLIKEENSNYIIKLANLSTNKLNIIVEGNSKEEVEEIVSKIPVNNKDFDSIAEVYKNYPGNFLSEGKRNLLLAKNYSKLRNESINLLLNPVGIYITSPEKDPYLLATDFLMSRSKNLESNTKEFNGKFYSILNLDIQNRQELIEIIKFSKENNIYLTGAPIHSHITAEKSQFEINIICFVSIIFLSLLCKIYFDSTKILLPIALSIMFGFIFGYSFTTILFPTIHILTLVFSTTLIGIGLDYSLHYYAKEENFKNCLTTSMLTTIIAFSALFFSNIEILKQIAVFTSFGLIGIYLFVLIFLSENDFSIKENNILTNFSFNKLKYLIVLIILSSLVFGSLKISFDDNVKSLYSPAKQLLAAEKLQQELFELDKQEFLLIKGKNIDEILEKSEDIGFGLHNFICSKARQKENLNLVDNLYKNDLKNYEKILDIKFNPQKSKIYDPQNFPLNSYFMLDNTTSFVIVPKHIENSFKISDEISKLLHKSRIKCLKLLPIVFCLMFLFLASVYGIKNSFKIILPPLISIAATASLLSIFGIKINLFHILAFFLILGFSLDYSIFQLKGGKHSKQAVLISALSTAFSFLILSFTSFKLISSLGITIFIGITVSYTLSLFMIKSKYE